VLINLISRLRRFTLGCSTVSSALVCTSQTKQSLSYSYKHCSMLRHFLRHSLQRTELLILKCLIFLPHFNQNHNPSTNFITRRKYETSRNTHLVVFALYMADGLTDITKLTVAFYMRMRLKITREELNWFSNSPNIARVIESWK
jgi:hypothetical protein